MGIMDFLKKQFVDVIDWIQEDEGVLVYQYPFQDREIQNGGQLTVRESQAALFVNEGKVADLFGPGRHTLNTQTLPLMTNLKHWDKAFASPFKSDIYFFSMKNQIGQKWGTQGKITLRDKDFGKIQIGAFGTYSYEIADPRLFFSKVSGTRPLFRVEDLQDQLRSVIEVAISSRLGQGDIPALDLAGQQARVSEEIRPFMAQHFTPLGLKLTGFLLQKVTLPEGVEKALEKNAAANSIDNMQKYTQFQMAESIGAAAANGGGTAGAGMGMAVGVTMGQQMAQMMGQTMNQQQAPQQQAPAKEDPVAILEKLKTLLEKGLITQAEYDTKKAEILSKL
jgi:membrane protease subunit (stomatin/prohibitin family)